MSGNRVISLRYPLTLADASGVSNRTRLTLTMSANQMCQRGNALRAYSVLLTTLAAFVTTPAFSQPFPSRPLETHHFLPVLRPASWD